MLATAVGGATALAGCNAPFDTGNDGVRVDALAVENQDDTAHEVSLRITRADGSDAFEATTSVDGGHETVYHEPVEGVAAYTVHGVLRQNRIDEALGTYATDEMRCIRPVFRITTDGELKLTARKYDVC